jgi:hypothetical protein
MDDTSEAILSLQPVTFRYKKVVDPDGTPQFGLVAEQVEKVNPDLVACDDTAIAPRPTGTWSLSPTISQYFTGGMLPDRAIPVQRDANHSGTAITQSAMAKTGRLGSFRS